MGVVLALKGVRKSRYHVMACDLAVESILFHGSTVSAVELVYEWSFRDLRWGRCRWRLT
jgi:hypothetical protein